MIGLVIAAGQGSRLRSVSSSKPLTPIAGKPLIAHVLAAALEGGVTSFLVVTGHEAPRVEACLAALASALATKIDVLRIDDPTRPNGLSAAAGSEAIGGEHLLLMSDHLFDPAIAAALVAAPAGPALRLAVDRRLDNPLVDLEDVTRVALDGKKRIRRIGKGLEAYDAWDTGCFRVGPGLAAAIRADVAAGGSGSLSAGVQRLADEKRAETLDVTGRFWLDVDDEKSLAAARRRVADQG